jgi:hypothetical protein
VSALLHEPDEAVERALFERRARVAGTRAGVPSLDVVLRAAREDSRETSSGHRRAWTALAIAAACVFAVMKTPPHDVSRSTIANDVDREASSASDRVGGVCEEQEVSACTLDSAYASMEPIAPAVHERRASAAPLATFSSSGALWCDRDEANRTEMP